MQSYSFYSRLPARLRKDLEDSIDDRVYKHYSMKKGNEHHLTLIVESRVLKLQNFARSLYKARNRAAKTLQARLRFLFKQRKVRQLLASTPSTPISEQRANQRSPKTHLPTESSRSGTDDRSMLYRGSAPNQSLN